MLMMVALDVRCEICSPSKSRRYEFASPVDQKDTGIALRFFASVCIVLNDLLVYTRHEKNGLRMQRTTIFRF